MADATVQAREVVVFGMACGHCGRGETVPCAFFDEIEKVQLGFEARGWRYTAAGEVRCSNCPDNAPPALRAKIDVLQLLN